jgi:hypothetical protein
VKLNSDLTESAIIVVSLSYKESVLNMTTNSFVAMNANSLILLTPQMPMIFLWVDSKDKI